MAKKKNKDNAEPTTADAFESLRGEIKAAETLVGNLEKEIRKITSASDCKSLPRYETSWKKQNIEAVIDGPDITPEVQTLAKAVARKIRNIFRHVVRNGGRAPFPQSWSSDVPKNSNLQKEIKELPPSPKRFFEDLGIEQGGKGEALWVIDRVARLPGETIKKAAVPKMSDLTRVAQRTVVAEGRKYADKGNLILFTTNPGEEVKCDFEIPAEVVFSWPNMETMPSIYARPAIVTLRQCIRNLREIAKDFTYW